MSDKQRIAYVTPYDDSYRSITEHTKRRMREWERNGATVGRFHIGDGRRQDRGALRNLHVDMRQRDRLVSQLRQWRPHIVYVRWLTPVPTLLATIRNIAPVVLDVHADDMVEVAGNSLVRRAFLKAVRGREVAAASAATFVVDELRHSRGFKHISVPTGCFPNGSWVERRARSSSGRKIVGLSVGSPTPWSGLDRFSALAQAMSSEADWVVVCPESSERAVRAEVHPLVRVVGTPDHESYISEVSSWSVAIGSLALERAGLKTASPLKVRDYVGIGVPTILPYWDEGLKDVTDPLILKVVGRDEAPAPELPSELVLGMLERAHGRDLLPSTSRAVAGSQIEVKRLAFLSQIAAV